jgi:tetratricopeptide (TPR) repeat protein
MLWPGWTDAVLRAALLVLGVSALTACSTLGGSSVVGAPSGATTSSEAAPSPALQARYASLLNRVQAGDAAAMTELTTFSTENPELAGPLLNLGLARGRAGDEVGARALFERASTVCSHCGPVWNELGVLDRQQGRFAEAEQAYRRAIELEPKYAPAYYNLAVLYEIYIPRPDLALENYERYLQISGTAGEGQDVEKWVGDLRRRVGATQESARAGGTS